MNRTIAAIIGLVAVVAIGGVVATIAIFRIYTPTPEEVVACQHLLPSNRQVGLGATTGTGGLLNFDLKALQESTGATPDQASAFLDCVGKLKSIQVTNGVNFPLQPLGQVANQWMRDSNDLRLTLMPGINDAILNNLRIGPAAGTKWAVTKDWCGPKIAGRCVECNPSAPDEKTAYVQITLRPDAPVERKQMAGKWPIAPPGTSYEPWQLVDQAGNRFLYECGR